MTTMDNENVTDYINQEQGSVPVFIKVLVFMLFIILVFTGIANLLPQVEGQAPKEVKVDLGALTMDAYIAMGETLFKGKGTCTLCHNNLGRAPDILVMNMEDTTTERLQAAAYKGDAKDSESYILESMVAPSKYVVPGYGKKGDPSPMPVIDKAPIDLSDVEMGAIIAFLQAKDGAEPTVKLPTDTSAAAETTPVAETPKAAASAEEVLTKYGCGACHAVLDSPSTIGPELKNIGSRSSREEIRTSIIKPSAVIAQGFPPIMPATFADQMTVKELEMVVDYLAAAKGSETQDSAEATVQAPLAEQESAPETTPAISADTEQKGEK